MKCKPISLACWPPQPVKYDILWQGMQETSLIRKVKQEGPLQIPIRQASFGVKVKGHFLPTFGIKNRSISVPIVLDIPSLVPNKEDLTLSFGVFTLVPSGEDRKRRSQRKKGESEDELLWGNLHPCLHLFMKDCLSLAGGGGQQKKLSLRSCSSTSWAGTVWKSSGTFPCRNHFYTEPFLRYRGLCHPNDLECSLGRTA